MSLDYEFQPLTEWPGERTKNRQKSRFDSPWGKTLDLLDRELEHLLAKNIIIQADCERSEIRIDGRLRASAKLRSPSVILSFDSKHGALSYPCDKFTNWQDNLRAIALSLEALRMVDRYGVTRRAEQYRGWEKLSGPGTSATPITTAMGTILVAAGIHGSRPIVASELESLYRKAVLRTHPDHGGSAEEFKHVQAAKETLDRHFGIA